MPTLILDNEAVQALADPYHPKHRRALMFCEAANLRGGDQRRGGHAVVVPTAVRVEAGWNRNEPGSATVNLLSRAHDVPLDPARADRAADIIGATGVSVVDATIAEIAASASRPVQVLTSDGTDMRHLASHIGIPITVIEL